MPPIDYTEQAGGRVKMMRKTRPRPAPRVGPYFDRSATSVTELRTQAVRATLRALAVAAERHDHAAVANLSAALSVLREA